MKLKKAEQNSFVCEARSTRRPETNIISLVLSLDIFFSDRHCTHAHSSHDPACSLFPRALTHATGVNDSDDGDLDCLHV